MQEKPLDFNIFLWRYSSLGPRGPITGQGRWVWALPKEWVDKYRQRKFESLTSDYIESCLQWCATRDVFYHGREKNKRSRSTNARHKSVWVGKTERKRCVFPRTFCKSSLQRAGRLWPKMPQFQLHFAWRGFRDQREMFVVLDAQSVEGCKLQVSGNANLSYDFPWQLQGYVCSWHAQYFWDLLSIHFKIAKVYWILTPSLRSICHFRRNSCRNACFLSFQLAFLKEVQKSFVFKLSTCTIEERLAQKLRFWALDLHVWRKSQLYSQVTSSSGSQWVS